MKLEHWSLHFYRLRYAREVVWANAREDAGLFALLRIEANGASGIAEGTLKATWSGVSPASLKAALEDFLTPRLRQVDLGDEAAVARAFAGIPENRLAKGMIESACWTLRAAAAKQPWWKLWNAGRTRELAWSVTRQEPAQMAAEAAEYLRALAAAGVTVAEDPCSLQPDAGFEALQKASPIPILVDDQVCAQVPQIRGGRIELPEVADLSRLVDRERLRQLAYNI